MKKTTLFYALGAALTLGSTLPSQAQEKEFYGRPSYWRPYDQKQIEVSIITFCLNLL